MYSYVYTYICLYVPIRNEYEKVKRKNRISILSLQILWLNSIEILCDAELNPIGVYNNYIVADGAMLTLTGAESDRILKKRILRSDETSSRRHFSCFLFSVVVFAKKISSKVFGTVRTNLLDEKQQSLFLVQLKAFLYEKYTLLSKWETPKRGSFSSSYLTVYTNNNWCNLYPKKQRSHLVSQQNSTKSSIVIIVHWDSKVDLSILAKSTKSPL